MRRLAMLAIACVLVTCAGPRPQAVVYVDTDAPVPRMFDRLSLDVLDAHLASLCPECGRDLVLDSETAWPVSFGVAPAADGSPRYVRARLYSSVRSSVTGSSTSTVIERIVQVATSGVPSRQLLVLSLDCAGVPADTTARTSCIDGSALSAPIATAPPYDGLPSRVGSAYASLATGCAGTPHPETGLFDEEVCIPGGVYWMGDYRLVGWELGADGVPEHVVAISPFYLDRYEWTVGRYRAALASGFVGPDVPLPMGNPPPWPDGHPAPNCSYTPDPSPTDPLQDRRPLTCLTAPLAEALCEWNGGRLVTEAQWEWAAGSRENEWFYPWGDDSPPCGAVVDFTGTLLAPGQPSPACDPLAGQRIFGDPVGTHSFDQSIDHVFDLSGNVAEIMFDQLEPYGTGCWDPSVYARVDPVCDPTPGDGMAIGRSLRSTGFRGLSSFNYHATNRGYETNEQKPLIGFRCARRP